MDDSFFTRSRLGLLCRMTGWALAAGLLAGAGPTQACGPWFPNNLLDGGDKALLVAPTARFAGELERMKLVNSRFQAVPPDPQSSLADQTADSEGADLYKALTRSGVGNEEIEHIRMEHHAARAALQRFTTEADAWEMSGEWEYDSNGRGKRAAPKSAPPAFPTLEPIAGLPGEFADYLEGARAWHNPLNADCETARASWERLLARPAAERHYKSTWAAFMLGKSWEEKDDAKATNYFRQVRDLAKHGFADSTGLAAASLGLEARVHLRLKNYEPAIELYLEQLATGDYSAHGSLNVTAGEALAADSDTLQKLAHNPRAQRVVTAYLIANPARQLEPAGESTDEAAAAVAAQAPGLAWLNAVEAAGVKDVDSAEKLALAAYQMNQMDIAKRWIKRAPGLPIAQWLLAKLLLRDGKLEAGTALLARVAGYFPIEPRNTNDTAPASLKDNLYVYENFECPNREVERQVLGELGTLQLSRKDYVQSLDALLRAGFWGDAAYVAERVLKLDELKKYVDENWARVSETQETEERENYPMKEFCPAELRTQIRYLLARRLTRSIRGDEAREYYPDDQLPKFDKLVAGLRTGWDESAPAPDRAKALFAAAVVTRKHGLELLGTEVEPDWKIHDGDYEEGVTWELRATNAANNTIAPARTDEIHRASTQNADPEERFHYRYQAAFLGWEAAKLMPNNSEETARVLCTSGSWLKNRDPETADLFYKSLVRRNRHTAIGAAADRMRWFPILDEDGQLAPVRPRTPRPESEPAPDGTELQPSGPPGETNNSPELTPAGDSLSEKNQVQFKTATGEEMGSGDAAGGSQRYVVKYGDSISSISHASQTTVREIFDANPSLNSTRLRVGQIILIPVRQ
jgi:hypothetical protein